MTLLYQGVLKMLPKTNTVFNVLPTRKLKTIFFWENISYNKNLVLQCKIIQHSSSDTVQYWHRTQIQILGNLPKWYIQIFLVSMVVEILITLI